MECFKDIRGLSAEELDLTPDTDGYCQSCNNESKRYAFPIGINSMGGGSVYESLSSLCQGDIVPSDD